MKKEVSVRIIIDTDNEGLGTCAEQVSSDGLFWRVKIGEASKRYGILPALTHELGHVVDNIINGIETTKDHRLNFSSEVFVSGTDIVNSEKRAWDVAKLIAFHKSRHKALKTYQFLMDRVVRLATFEVF